MSRPNELWPEPWASQIYADADAVEGELERALAASTPPSPVQRAAEKTVRSLLEKAREATRAEGSRRRGLYDWWRGTSVERSHYYLHAAKTALVDALDEAALDAAIPAAVARLGSSVPPTDVRRPCLDALLSNGALGPGEKRARLKVALQIGYKASDQTHARVRGFRNLIYVVGVVVLLFMGAVVAVSATHPTWASLCFTSAAAPSGPAADTLPPVTACPSGDAAGSKPAPEDVGIVAGLGLVGGALAAVFAIRKVRGSSTPYDLPLAAAFLKVPTGALTAVAGMLLLGGGFIPGLSALDSQRQILAYALLFGYAQQVATQLVDKQAQNVLNAIPSKDPQAPQQSQVMAPAIALPAAAGATSGAPLTSRSAWERGRRARGRRGPAPVRVPYRREGQAQRKTNGDGRGPARQAHERNGRSESALR